MVVARDAYSTATRGKTNEAKHPIPTNKEFRENRISIMVATDAYGQGIDKPDIDVIVHWQPPLNMETQRVGSGAACICRRRNEKIRPFPKPRYVNQIGRAGRDGRHSLCRLCWSRMDQ